MMERDDALKFWDQVFNSDWGVDCFGTWMYKYDYGDTEKKRIRHGGDGKSHTYGWEIDHIRPKSNFKNESDANFLNNYEPMHWENNREKADNYPQFDIGNSKFKVVVCSICSINGYKGYGIVDKNGKRIDWKGKTKRYFPTND